MVCRCSNSQSKPSWVKQNAGYADRFAKAPPPVLPDEEQLKETARGAVLGRDWAQAYRSEGYKVTDITNLEWCQVKTVLQLLISEMRTSSPAMERGSNYHLQQEEELYLLENVVVTSPEELWAHRLLANAVSLTALWELGVAREVWVFGLAHRVWLRGIVDEVRLLPLALANDAGPDFIAPPPPPPPPPAPAPPLLLKRRSRRGSTSSSSSSSQRPVTPKFVPGDAGGGAAAPSGAEQGGLEQAGSSSGRGAPQRRLQMSELKTTGSASLPAGTITSGGVQLMLYHDIWKHMRSQEFLSQLPAFWRKQGVDADAPLPPQVIQGLARLMHDHPSAARLIAAASSLTGSSGGGDGGGSSGDGSSSSASVGRGGLPSSSGAELRPPPARPEAAKTEAPEAAEAVALETAEAVTPAVAVAPAAAAPAAWLPTTVKELAQVMVGLMQLLPGPEPILELQSVRLQDGVPPKPLKLRSTTYDAEASQEALRCGVMFWRGLWDPAPADAFWKCKMCKFKEICPSSRVHPPRGG